MFEEIIIKIVVTLTLLCVYLALCTIREICKGFMVFIIGRTFKKPSDVIKLAQVIYHAPTSDMWTKYKAIFGHKNPNRSHEKPERSKKTAQTKEI